MKKLLILLFLLANVTVSVFCAQKIIRVGVMLPFKDNEAHVSLRAVDFYRGIAMAIDSLKKDGTSFRIYTYNTANTSVNTILSDTIIPHLDVIFGPDDRMALKVVSDFVASYGTKIVDAFVPTSDAVINNPNFYIAYPSEAIIAEDAANLFKAHFSAVKTNVVMIDTRKVAHPFVAEMKKVAGKVRFLQSGFTQNQLGSRLSKNKVNILVLSSSDKESAVEIMEQIALYKHNNPRYDIRVIGYPEWEDYGLSLADKMFQLETYVYSPFYNNMSSLRNKHFTTMYNRLFCTQMESTRPVMALFGFDCAYFMLKALARYGRDYAGQDVYTVPLQNAFQFRPLGNSGGMVNHFVQFVHYKTDRQVELIKLK